MALGLIRRFLIHFEFIFVYGMRKGSVLIVLLVAVWFSSPPSRKRLSFLRHTFCLLGQRLVHHRCWVYLQALHSVPLISVLVWKFSCFISL